MAGGRVEYTSEDRQLLAEFLVKHPQDTRLRPSLYKEFAQKHPHHTEESWREHYRRTGREDIDRRIANIKRKRSKAKKAAIAAAAQVASASPAPKSKDKGKKRAREPSPKPSTEEESEEEDEEEEKEQSEEEKRPRTRFVAKDLGRLVRYLADAEERDESKEFAYRNLAEDYPEHTAISWQTFRRDNNSEKKVDDAVHARLARLKKERKEAARRPSTSANAAPASTPKPKPKAPRPSSTNAEPSRRASTSTAISNGKNKPVVLRSSSSPEVQTPKAKKAKVVDDRQPVAGPSSERRKSISAPAAAAEDKDEDDEDEDAEDEEPRQPNPVFTDEDEYLIVQKLAVAEIKELDRTEVWKHLDLSHPQHSEEEWKAHFVTNRASLFPRVGVRVAEIYRDQARKSAREEREAAKAAEEKAKAARKSKGKDREVVDKHPHEVVVVEKRVKEVVTVAEAQKGNADQIDKAAPLQPHGASAAPLASPTAQNPSPPTPKPTPPSSSHSQSRKSQPIEVAITTSRLDIVQVEQQQQQPVAAASAPPASTHSTDPEPSTQHSSLDPKVVVTAAPNVAVNADSKNVEESDPSALAAAEMQRQRSLPSPFIKADQYPPEPAPAPAPTPAPTTTSAQLVSTVVPAPVVEKQAEDDDSHSLPDSDDRRMEELLRSEGVEPQPEVVQPVVVLERVSSDWLPLTAAQVAFVNGVYEVDEQLKFEEEQERIALEEQERSRIAAEKAAVEVERQRVEREKAAAAEEDSRKAREKEQARLRLLAEERVKEAQRVAEEVEQRRVEAEKKKQEEEEERRHRQAQKEMEGLARRHGEQAAEAKRRQEAIEAAAVVAQAEARRMAAIKEGKKRAVESDAPAPVAKKATRGSSAVPSRLPNITPSRPIATSTTTTTSTARKRARDSTDGSAGVDDHLPPTGKKPRASLTASARKPSASVSASPAPTPAPAPAASTPSAATLTLKDELALRRNLYSLPKRGPHALYLSVSCPTNFKILDKACTWFSPTRRPAEGTAEYAELEKWVAKEVWSYDDDVIVLAGTSEAQEAIERKKGRKAVSARRAVLFSAGIELVSQLKKGWPWASK